MNYSNYTTNVRVVNNWCACISWKSYRRRVPQIPFLALPSDSGSAKWPTCSRPSVHGAHTPTRDCSAYANPADVTSTTRCVFVKAYKDARGGCALHVELELENSFDPAGN